MYEVARELTKLKREEGKEWLQEVSSQSLGYSMMHLDRAFTNFFKHKKGFPKFKSKKKSRASFTHNLSNDLNEEKGLVYATNFREGIRCVFTRPVEGKIKRMTFSRTKTGKYYVGILVETPEEFPTPPPPREELSVGIDLGLKTFATLDDGTKIDTPKFLQGSLQRLRRAQKHLSRCQYGSKNWEKARDKVARLHEHVANSRKDFLHKVSHKLVCDNQATTLCIENLDITEMIEKAPSRRKRSIYDAGWRMFRGMLEYKCEWHGKNLMMIGQFEPSSKICSCCGEMNKDLGKKREWTCKKCETHHDRDINAAKNIKKIAFCKQNTVSAKILPPDRRDVKPVESSVLEFNEAGTEKDRLTPSRGV